MKRNGINLCLFKENPMKLPCGCEPTVDRDAIDFPDAQALTECALRTSKGDPVTRERLSNNLLLHFLGHSIPREFLEELISTESLGVRRDIAHSLNRHCREFAQGSPVG